MNNFKKILNEDSKKTKILDMVSYAVRWADDFQAKEIDVIQTSNGFRFKWQGKDYNFVMRAK